jgi:hypothetical protein
VTYYITYVHADNWLDQVTEDEMGRECSTNRDEEFIYDIGGRARRRETTRKTNT